MAKYCIFWLQLKLIFDNFEKIYRSTRRKSQQKIQVFIEKGIFTKFIIFYHFAVQFFRCRRTESTATATEIYCIIGNSGVKFKIQQLALAYVRINVRINECSSEGGKWLPRFCNIMFDFGLIGSENHEKHQSESKQAMKIPKFHYKFGSFIAFSQRHTQGTRPSKFGKSRRGPSPNLEKTGNLIFCFLIAMIFIQEYKLKHSKSI